MKQLEFPFVDDIDKKFFVLFLNKELSEREVESLRRLKDYGLKFSLEKKPSSV